MRIDEDGKTWFEVGDVVRPRTVTRRKPDGGVEYVPHEKATGGIKKKGRGIETKLEDTVLEVDPHGQNHQIQLRSWVFDESGVRHTGEMVGWCARWESNDWYELVVPDTKVKRGGGASGPSPG